MNRQSEYQQAIDSLHYTAEQKQALARRAAEAAASTKAPRRRPLVRMALTAAVLAAVLAVGAGASGVLKTAAEAFSPVFGSGAAQTEILDTIGRPVGASDTDHGVTITADAIMGDACNAAIIYTIHRDDGAALLPEGTDAGSLLMGGFGSTSLSVLGGVHGSSWFVADDTDPSTLQFVETLSSDTPIINSTATAAFQDLQVFDDAAGQARPVVKGTWKLRFAMTYPDTSVSLGNGETFQQDGMVFTVDSITISPVAVQVNYTAAGQVHWSDAPSGQASPEDRLQSQRYLENVPVLLTKTDGTVVDLTNSGGSIKPGKGITVCSKGQIFEEIIPMEEMASLTVGDVVYPISAD